MPHAQRVALVHHRDGSILTNLNQLDQSNHSLELNRVDEIDKYKWLC